MVRIVDFLLQKFIFSCYFLSICLIHQVVVAILRETPLDIPLYLKIQEIILLHLAIDVEETICGGLSVAKSVFKNHLLVFFTHHYVAKLEPFLGKLMKNV